MNLPNQSDPFEHDPACDALDGDPSRHCTCDLHGIIVEFRCAPHSVPAVQRIKRLLKYAGRDLALRCTSVRPHG